MLHSGRNRSPRSPRAMLRAFLLRRRNCLRSHGRSWRSAWCSTVAVTGVAVAGGTTGAELNDARVVGKVTPVKLDKKKFKPVDLFLGVENSPDSTGNAGRQRGRRVHRRSRRTSRSTSSNTPICDVELAERHADDDAKDACEAAAGPTSRSSARATPWCYGPGAFCVLRAAGPTRVLLPTRSCPCSTDPTQDELQLHTYGHGLGAASPVVDAEIIESNANGYGQALDRPERPGDRLP